MPAIGGSGGVLLRFKDKDNFILAGCVPKMVERCIFAKWSAANGVSRLVRFLGNKRPSPIIAEVVGRLPAIDMMAARLRHEAMQSHAAPAERGALSRSNRGWGQTAFEDLCLSEN